MGVDEEIIELKGLHQRSFARLLIVHRGYFDRFVGQEKCYGQGLSNERDTEYLTYALLLLECQPHAKRD
jgi:hypothetical protein